MPKKGLLCADINVNGNMWHTSFQHAIQYMTYTSSLWIYFIHYYFLFCFVFHQIRISLVSAMMHESPFEILE